MRFKSIAATVLASVMVLGLAACGQKKPSETTAAPAAETTAAKTAAAETTAAETTAAETTAAPAAERVKPSATVRIAGLNGPTAMSLAKLTTDYKASGDNSISYSVSKVREEVVNGLLKGDLDVACVPANMAATLFNKSQGAIQVAAISTLNVLYLAGNDVKLNSLEDLKGKTVYSTGKGATPDAVLNKLLTSAGLTAGDDVTIEFKSEPAEVAAMLTAKEGNIGFLPEPFLTTVTSKNDKIKALFSGAELWKKYVGPDEEIVTGVLVARKDFLAKNEAWFKQFLADYKKDIEWTVANPAEAGKLIGEQGIVPAKVAAKALPKIGLTYIDGSEMKAKLEAYLGVLGGFNPKLIGGKLPSDDFYYGAK